MTVQRELHTKAPWVTIHQDGKISALLGEVYVKQEGDEKPKVLKVRGFRVQVYAGNNRFVMAL